MTIERKKLPIAALERIDDLCTEFERRWQENNPGSIESFLSGNLSEDERDLLLSELLVLEIDYRRRIGQKPEFDEYAGRFPNRDTTLRKALGIEPVARAGFQPPGLDEVGKLFPSLSILSLLGAGGMGAVYKARQKGLDRLVALKILPREFSEDIKFALRFTREARTLARLNHPNIVSVFEFGNVDDVYYFLMEFVDGSTLREVVRAGQLQPEHALAIVPHLCDALQYAHDHGVVHRDIKPENILMAKDGSVKVADFGLSRIVNNGAQAAYLTQTHQVLGTPRYMAPEQFEGARQVDHRADIYSLGVVFYEMLTGELPIGRFAVPSQKVQVDIRLDEVVLRTLEKEPQRRYQSASQIKSDLHSISLQSDESFAPTQVYGTPDDDPSKMGLPTPTSLHDQEVAARLLLSRRELMDRVKNSLRPLHTGHIIQILCGVALIIVGAMCWGPNVNVPHRLICGLSLHIYGIVVIGTGAHVCTRIGRMDYSVPVQEIRESLNKVRKAYLMTGPVVGFPWWLMWLPLCVAVGFEAVMYPNCLWISIAIGVPGFLISVLLYLRSIFSKTATAERWKRSFAGRSLSIAYSTLGEIEKARIQ